MKNRPKILAIVGSYRKGGAIDSAIDEILVAAADAGAEVKKEYLIERRIEYCSNCRACTQEGGTDRGKCSIDDDMPGLLDEIDEAAAVILGSPMNVGTVTAVMKTFVERLICYAHWPWGAAAPKLRREHPDKIAVLVASSAAPSLLARWSSQLLKVLKSGANMLGARPVGVLFIGLVAMERKPDIGERARRKARRLGRKLATRIGAGASR